MVVAGIQDWPRRVRELRVQFGWAIVSGVTAKEMHSEDEFTLKGINATELGSDDYILLTAEKDRDAAHRWNLASVVSNK